jgi:hypothetical protein
LVARVIVMEGLTPLDRLALVSLAYLCASFYFVRTSLVWFLAACGAVIGLFGFVSWQWADHGVAVERLVILPGLALSSLGLLMVRIVLTRSVSLRLLSAYVGEPAEVSVGADIARRVEEAEHYRLVTRRDDRYTLTVFGRVVARIMELLYRTQTP